MDMTSTMDSVFVSVFPNVPERPGLPCTGEDSEYFLFYLILAPLPSPRALSVKLQHCQLIYSTPFLLSAKFEFYMPKIPYTL